jgi:hypothetical protein
MYKLNPSGAERWVTCHGSVYLSTKVPKPPESVYAREGTVAADVAEHYVQGDERFRWPEEVTSEMREVGQEWAAHLSSLAEISGGVCAPEVKIKLPKIFGGGSGRADGLVLSDSMLAVADLKFGRTEVEAYKNRQLVAYAGGFLANPVHRGIARKRRALRLEIFQPRRGGWKTWEIGPDELEEQWDELVYAAEEIQVGSRQLEASEEGCRWCPAKAFCPLLNESVTTLFKEATDDSRGGGQA